jgi:hypothetical protein
MHAYLHAWGAMALLERKRTPASRSSSEVLVRLTRMSGTGGRHVKAGRVKKPEGVQGGPLPKRERGADLV